MPALSGVAARSLAARWREGAERARALGHPVLVSVSKPAPPPDPIRALAHFASVSESSCTGWEVALWARPAAGLAMVGLGTAAALTARGPQRFAQLSAAWRQLVETALYESAGQGPARGPIGLGGFAFEDDSEARDGAWGPEAGPWESFPPALIAVPRVLLWRAGRAGGVVISALADPHRADAGPRPDDAELADVPFGDGPDGEGLAGKAAQQETPAMPGLAAEFPIERPAVEFELQEDDARRWKATVAETARAVREGRLAKAVLARRVTVRLPQEIEVDRLLAALWQAYPHCSLFAFRRSGRWFAGATPERLVKVQGGNVYSSCLAGSAPRGRDAEEDRLLEQALRANPKERREHALVLEAIRGGLNRVCRRVESPAEPSVWKLPTIQHLHTLVAGQLLPSVGVLEAAGQLHPTPAVGGVPREAALEWIRRHEGVERGWYAGPVGWVGPAGEGEFAVAIRCAVIEGRRAVLYAGCGILGESDPEAEYRESWLKLRPMLAALKAASGGQAPARREA